MCRDEHVCLSVCSSVYSACLCVCMSVCEYISGTTRPIFTILGMLPMAAARFSSGGVAIRCVLPVVCMALCLRIIGDPKRHILRVSQQGAARIWHGSLYSNWPTTGSTWPGAESDVDCGGFAAAGPAGRRYQSIAARRERYVYIEFTENANKWNDTWHNSSLTVITLARRNAITT